LIPGDEWDFEFGLMRSAKEPSLHLRVCTLSDVAAVVALKKQLREAAKLTRANAFRRHGAAASKRIAAQGLTFSAAGRGAIVSGFMAIGEEIDPAPLMLRLRAQGYSLGLPVMQGRDRPLLFRAWTPGEPLIKRLWGIREPQASAPEVDPDVVLTPLLAFDRTGYRLGYGAGYFDWTLASLRSRKPIVAVGLAYDEQEVDAVPHLDYDQRLDWVLTPSGPLKCAGN
jgi:5-formyltetrahydrofolate cyclo-ligase